MKQKVLYELARRQQRCQEARVLLCDIDRLFARCIDDFPNALLELYTSPGYVSLVFKRDRILKAETVHTPVGWCVNITSMFGTKTVSGVDEVEKTLFAVLLHNFDLVEKYNPA